MSGQKQRDQIMGHGHENDGIEEYDNPLPDWWIGLFFFSVVWGIGYAADYHFISQRSQAGYYDIEMAEAAKMWPAPAKDALPELTDANIAAGKEIFATTCAPCHNADMTGKIGPNLIDTTWIHGGSLEQIHKTVTNGVLEKGMPAWGATIGPEKVNQVSAFVYSAGPKLGLRAADVPPPAPPVDPAAPPVDPAAPPVDPAAPPAPAPQ